MRSLLIDAVTPKRNLRVGPLPACSGSSHPRTRAPAAGAGEAAVAPAIVARQLGEVLIKIAKGNCRVVLMKGCFSQVGWRTWGGLCDGVRGSDSWKATGENENGLIF